MPQPINPMKLVPGVSQEPKVAAIIADLVTRFAHLEYTSASLLSLTLGTRVDPDGVGLTVAHDAVARAVMETFWNGHQRFRLFKKVLGIRSTDRVPDVAGSPWLTSGHGEDETDPLGVEATRGGVAGERRDIEGVRGRARVEGEDAAVVSSPSRW